MNETQTTDFSDFFEAFEGSPTTEESADEAHEATGDDVSGENAEGTNRHEAENLPSDEDQQPDSNQKEDKVAGVSSELHPQRIII